MVTTTRTQNRYDHRLRELVRTTQDVSYAVRRGVPRSTARGWLSDPSVHVVTLDPLNMEATQLRCEVLRLQARIRKLIALLRVLLVVLRVSRFSLNQTRLPDGRDKRSLLRAIDQARSAPPLRSVLRIARRSSSRYHHWKQENDCGLDDGASCPRVFPHQLMAAEVEAVHGLPTVLTDGGTENFHGPVDELVHSGLLPRVLAQTEITYSHSMIESWWRVLKHPWLFLNSLDTVRAVQNLVAFYVQEHHSRLPHSAFPGQTPEEMYFQRGDGIPEELEAARQQARRARAETNRKQDCEACELLAASPN